MRQEIPVSELQNDSIFIGVPMYGGMCYGSFAKSLIELNRLSQSYGIATRYYFLFNESLVTRARNYIADSFLRSECTHLMFIDSDVTFNARDVISLLALQRPDTPYDIACGAYPKKVISWEKIAKAVNKGIADKNPEILEDFVGDYAFNTVPGVSEIKIGEPVEVLEGGTGFMMIRRGTLERWREAYPGQRYRPDHARDKEFDGSHEITCFFDAVIDKESRRYLSEDFMFCQWARKAGLRVWLCPWMKLKHTGTYAFGGSLQALASIGSVPGIDRGFKRGP